MPHDDRFGSRFNAVFEQDRDRSRKIQCDNDADAK
jgi:hypothetical protein